MSDKNDSNKGELTISKDHSLAIKRSDLVKRGLQLTHELKRRQIRVLIGNWDEGFKEALSEFMAKIIQRKLGSKFDLRVISMLTISADEVLELAQSYVFDIFVLFLNNIRFPSDNFSADKTLEKVLKLVTHLRTTYGKPVIALYHWPRDPSYVPKAKLAGASFAFYMPPYEGLAEAFEKCLDTMEYSRGEQTIRGSD